MNFDFYYKGAIPVFGEVGGERQDGTYFPCVIQSTWSISNSPEERRNNRTAMPQSSVLGCNLIVIVITAVLITVIISGPHTTTQTSPFA